MIKIGVSGACGRMGQRIIACAKQNKKIKIVFGLEHNECSSIGTKIDGVEIIADPGIIKTCDVLIDFSSPQAAIEHLEYAVKYKKSAVIGVTGLTEEHLRKINLAVKKIPMVYSSNMSLGVNVIFKVIDMAAGILRKYNVSITEEHHIHKKDKPSGTAKKLADIINQHEFDVKYEDIKAVREGEVMGNHTVVFDSAVDTIAFSHQAKTRDIFAQGAVIAGLWIKGKKPGLYSMIDVLFGKQKIKS